MQTDSIFLEKFITGLSGNPFPRKHEAWPVVVVASVTNEISPEEIALLPIQTNTLPGGLCIGPQIRHEQVGHKMVSPRDVLIVLRPRMTDRLALNEFQPIQFTSYATKVCPSLPLYILTYCKGQQSHQM
jgi:hypothetical protein